MAVEASPWKSLANAKFEAIRNSIPEKWRITTVPSIQETPDVTGSAITKKLSPLEIYITETDAVGIVTKVSTGEWKAEDVTKAFCHRAGIAHQMVKIRNVSLKKTIYLTVNKTNCLHETFFDAAINDAKRLDNYYAENKVPIGPLHGLPISLKDQFHVKGVETTMGYIGWINTFMGKKGTGQEKVFESEMVKELRALGAVLYCKTSVPHTLMCGETMNNIIGYTTNPKNRNLSSGGSSGGEGALIGLKGSPLGFGSDIGGSIRIPAAFNGLYGLKPSSGRLPYEGVANSMDGQNSVLSVVGPLSHSVGALKLVFQAILSQEPWLHDPLCHEIPWREDQEGLVKDLLNSKKQLAFGIYRHDSQITPHPPVLRAMDIVVETIEKLGHKIIVWEPPSHRRGNDLCVSYYARYCTAYTYKT